eukprot:11154362-Lingulodinium_polyedra.AAC.1
MLSSLPQTVEFLLKQDTTTHEGSRGNKAGKRARARATHTAANASTNTTIQQRNNKHNNNNATTPNTNSA